MIWLIIRRYGGGYFKEPKGVKRKYKLRLETKEETKRYNKAIKEKYKTKFGTKVRRVLLILAVITLTALFINEII